MEPTKIENHIKSELQNRTIEPSAAAWDRLDAMLTVAEKPKKAFGWWQVAASFIGFLLTVGVLVNQSKPLIDQPQNEITVNNQNIPPIIQQNNNPNKQENAGITNIATIKKTTKSTNDESVVTNKFIKKQTVQNGLKIDDQKNVATILNIEKPIINKDKINTSLQQEISIEIVTSKPKYINPAALLAEIENKEVQPKVQIAVKNEPYRVNAKSLLSQVDSELETSFRQRVLQKITKTYQNTKVAVTDRNNAK